MAAKVPDERVPVRRPGTPGPRGGGLFLSRVQQTRMLDAAVEVLAEEGVKRLSAHRVSARAGMSSKTFYDLFAGGEDCFVAVFDRAVEQWEAELAPVWAGEGEWVDRVRAALVVLLASLERDRALARIVFVDGMGAGPRVLARRAEVLDRVAGFVDEGRAGAGEGAGVVGELPPMTAAGVVGAAFSVIHARLVGQDAAETERDTESERGTAPERDTARLVEEQSGRRGASHPPGRGTSYIRTQEATCATHTSWPKRGFERSECLPASVGRRDAPPIAALTGLLNDLVAMVVLPYRGREAAARELARPAPELPAPELSSPASSAGREASRSRTHRAWRTDRRSTGSTIGQHTSDRGRRDAPAIAPLAPAEFRLTVRTQMALVAVAEASARGHNPSNLEVSRRIGISGRGTVSRMMTRLQDQGLIENTRGRDRKGVAKAWRLTPYGQAVLDAHRPGPGGRASSGKDPAAVRGGKLVPKRGPQTATRSPIATLTRPESEGFRLTVRTHLVLTAISEHIGASNREIADAAGVRDEGQISKLLARLADRGLIHNGASASAGFAKAWRLTPQGEALLRANTPAHETRAA